MFKLYQWPRKSPRHCKTGRPKSKNYSIARRRKLTVLEDLYDKGLLTENEYLIARWFVRAWHRNLSAIEAPRIKTSVLDLSKIQAKVWSEYELKKIQEDWQAAREVLNKQDRYSRQSVECILFDDFTSAEVTPLRSFLRQLDERMSHGD